MNRDVSSLMMLLVTLASGSCAARDGSAGDGKVIETRGAIGTAGTDRSSDPTGLDGGMPSEAGGTGDEPSAPPGVRFVGRVDATDASNVRFAWSGTGIIARFSSRSVNVRLTGGQQYTVLLDGELLPKLTPSGAVSVLAENLSDEPHEIEIYRRTEANQGESVFSGFDLGAGVLLPRPAAPERRIEIIGDSITCGYGNEGPDMNCGFTPDTENHYASYGAIAARAVGAELTTVAWSGKGVVCNFGDDAASCTDPMPTYYDRILPNRPDSLWSFSEWQPHAVVINLGTNDFGTMVDPAQADFETAYTDFSGSDTHGLPGRTHPQHPRSRLRPRSREVIRLYRQCGAGAHHAG